MSNYKEDESQLNLLRNGGEAVWQQFYDQHRGPFRAFFMQYGRMSPEEAGGLLQDAMVVFHYNATTGKLSAPLQSYLKTYLIGIGKVLLRRKGGSTAGWDDQIPDEPVAPIADRIADQEAAAKMARALLDRIGEPCRSLLEMVYIKEFVMEAVAENLGLPSEGAARKRKFDCLQKMKELLK
ncbi:MAG: RNA polymerase sigma factor [Saprospiraceae bacterium]